MDFIITNCLPFFLQIDEIFYQIILSHINGRCPSHILRRCPNKSLVINIDVIKDKAFRKFTLVFIQRE